MATKLEKPKDPEEVRRSQIARGIRPLWIYVPGDVPRQLSCTRRDLAAQAKWFCREGDEEWRDISELKGEWS